MSKVDEPGAIPMFVDENRVFIDNNNATWVCVHKTAGGTSAQSIANYFATTPEMTSVHYVVGQDGTVVQCVLEKDGAAGNCCLEPGHAGYLPNDNLNWWTVSIEHVDPATDNNTPLTDAQKQASFQLIKHICERHNIPMRPGDATGGIIGHMDIAPQSRARCPGNYPWSELWQYLQSGGSDTAVLDISQVSNYFTEVIKDTRWHCPKTKQDIAYGILTYYRSCTGVALNGLSQYGLPLTGEQNVPGVQGATYQIFERGVVVFDPSHKSDSVPGITGPCYPGHLDKFTTQLPQNPPQPPVVMPNTQAAISTIQAVQTALQSAVPALQSALKDLEPS